MERLIAAAAREMGIDQVAMRKLNHIKPEEMPYKTASGTTYDSGEFTALLDKALALAAELEDEPSPPPPPSHGAPLR